MTQAEALSILKTGANVFLTGEPGAGKTHTVNEYVRYLREHDIEPAITASTGIAATHIGGMTIHSWSGVGIKSKLDRYDLDKIASSEYVVRRVRRTKVLIIDEISMLHPGMLTMVDAVCREILQCPEPFGGIQIVFVGDFFQLPPISRNNDEESISNLFGKEKEGRFAYESAIWQKLKLIICYLTEQHRQDDDRFLSVLSAIRSDAVEEMHFDHIMSRTIRTEDAPEEVTRLFSHNSNVDYMNNEALEKIPGTIESFLMVSDGKEALVAMLKKGCLSPEVLQLKKEATVMFTKNNPKEGFVNGTLGTITGFAVGTRYPIVRIKSGKQIVVEPMDWVVEENGKIKASISQIPLRLAWAITVHKSQGMSLDAAVMDLSQVFEFGQGYVALSRVRRLSGLYILGINEQALKVHPNVLEKDIDFKKQSAVAQNAFAKIKSKELQKMQDNFIATCGGTNSIKKKVTKTAGTGFDTIRAQYPNAYRPWNKAQDKELKELFLQGTKISDLMRHFGRKRGAINARLEKLELSR